MSTDIHTHLCNAVPLVWGSLRLAPIVLGSSVLGLSPPIPLSTLSTKYKALILSFYSSATSVSFDLLCDNLNGHPKHTRTEEGRLASH